MGGSIPVLRRSSGEGNGNPLQYSCLENPMNRATWWATVHGSQKVGQNSSDLACMHMSHEYINTKILKIIANRIKQYIK